MLLGRVIKQLLLALLCSTVNAESYTRLSLPTVTAMLHETIRKERSIVQELKTHVKTHRAKLNELIKLKDGNELLTRLEQYVSSQRDKLNALQRFVDSVWSDYSNKSADDVNKLLQHPLNAFCLIYRLAYRWKRALDQASGFPFANDIPQRLAQALPVDAEDMEKVLADETLAILALQEFYKLPTDALASGDLRGVAATRALTRDERYLIGKVAIMQHRFVQSAEWMDAALRAAGDVDAVATDRRIYRYRFIAYAQTLKNEQTLKPEDDETYARWLEDLVRVRPSDEHRLLREMDEWMESDKRSQSQPGDHRHLLATACGAEAAKRVRNVAARQALDCYYLAPYAHDPKFLFYRVKMEEVWRSPDIFRVYDVVSDADIADIKRAALRRLKSSTDFGYRGAKIATRFSIKPRPKPNWVSKSAWLGDDVSPAVARLSARLKEVVNFDADRVGFDPLQVVNFGVGGHLAPGDDPATKERPGLADQRYATAYVVMSDVKAGGQLLFMSPDHVVAAVELGAKGSALVWSNVHENLAMDERVQIAECPVIVGNKWIAYKFMHLRT